MGAIKTNCQKDETKPKESSRKPAGTMAAIPQTKHLRIKYRGSGCNLSFLKKYQSQNSPGAKATAAMIKKSINIPELVSKNVPGQ